MIFTDKQLLLIDKPAGATSFDCIRILRRKWNEEFGKRAPKMGHAGTLDPMATGLMLVGVGAGTKELSKLLKLDKEYETEILLGVSTDTGDITGTPTDTRATVHLTRARIGKIIREMAGAHHLAVPAYSAIKRGGEPLYKKARRGERVTPPQKPMTVTDVELVDIKKEGDFHRVEVRFEVTSGTYIRSLAEEVGKRLGVPATLSALRRTRVGMYHVRDAITLT